MGAILAIDAAELNHSAANLSVRASGYDPQPRMYRFNKEQKMAKRKPHDDSSSSKMTVMFFQLEGSDATLQEGFRTITSALSQALPQSQSAIPGRISPPRLSGPRDDACEPETDVFEVPSVTTPTSNGSRKRSLKSPIVLDLDLTSGETPLAEFLNDHPTQRTSKRYLMIAYWFKHHRTIEEVSADHIHTAFRHMSWQTPKDAIQPIRDMKCKMQWFHKGETKGHYKINHVGENEVQKLLDSKK